VTARRDGAACGTRAALMLWRIELVGNLPQPLLSARRGMRVAPAEASKSGVGEREHAPQFSAPGESRKDAKARADGAGFRNWRRKLAADIDICLNEAKLATARE